MGAADVKPAAEIEAYRVLSSKICEELEKTNVESCAPASSAVHAETTSSWASEQSQKLSEGRWIVRNTSPQMTEQGTSAADRPTTHQRPADEQDGNDHHVAEPNTFLTALRHGETLAEQDEAPPEKLPILPGKTDISTATREPSRGRAEITEASAQSAVKPGSGQGESANGGTFRQGEEIGDFEVHDVGGRRGDSGRRPRREDGTRGIGTLSGAAAGAEEVAPRGPVRLWDDHRPPMDSFDEQRATLTSAG